MTVRLKKEYPTILNSVYQAALKGDMATIERALNDLDRAISDHKSGSKAHNSKNIVHEGYELAALVNRLRAKMSNLATEQDGNNIKELIVSRVALDAKILATLDERLDYDFQLTHNKIDDARMAVPFKEILRKHNGNFTKAMKEALQLGLLYPIWIVIPSGSYTISEKLTIYKDTRITFSDGVYLTRTDGFVGSMFVNGQSGDMFRGYNGHGNIKIDGYGELDSAGDRVKEQCSVFGFGHARGIKVSGITVSNVCGGHAFDLAGIEESDFDDIKFEGFVDYKGDRWFSAAIQVDLMRSPGNFGSFGAYDNTVTRKINVENCKFRKSKKLGGYARAIDSHTSTDGYLYSHINFKGNTVEDTTEWAVSGNKWQDIVVEGNTFNNCYGGVRTLLPSISSQYTQDANGNPTNRINKVKRQKINSNTFTNITGKHAIQVYGRKGYQTIDDVQINGNTIDGVKLKHGIQVSDVNDFIIKDNTVKNVGHHGILVTRSSFGTVKNNTVKDVKGNGLRLEEGSCDYVTSKDNTIMNTGYSGISVSGNSKGFVSNNDTVINAGTRSVSGSNNEYDGLILMTGVSDSKITEIRVTGKRMRHGINFTNTTSNITHYGNNVKGAGYSESYKDSSKNSITTPVNIS
ncbi:right-handed parallel beta-helix repeat-containing protein [Bacillus pumilus]|uniref:right-handed parallel beta-helix repeat-containing protein n=1 Tax=Bacillus pumilus TaxID=1408 RepID=UPI002ABE4E40|nr:right-handed parallel beta-helix repeat-containing protein [Bacillus pumilus]